MCKKNSIRIVTRNETTGLYNIREVLLKLILKFKRTVRIHRSFVDKEESRNLGIAENIFVKNR